MTDPVRCAIYTRKSTDDGLEQAFNSLDAQREACAAYVNSQRHEGWILVPDNYDDGGFSGGNMDRPGLKQLLHDVRSGKVNVIVVYKVDRLTRSLADFAKIVETLDGAGATFVSVTQAFNTTTSMGRLTLNVLLSFAQFEREVTGERIRDKIAASKKRGMWMGGNPSLGYDVKDRQLIVNEAEAETVRHIMRRYLAAGSVRALLEELNQHGIVTKVNKGRGGVRFGRGSLRHLLQNPLYLGEVHFKGEVHLGQHQAIVDRALWDAVQAAFAASAVEAKHGRRATEPSLLSGMLWDPNGGRMTPSHAVKKGQRYRYYVTLADHRSGKAAFRFSAPLLEEAVIDRLKAWLSSSESVRIGEADQVQAEIEQARREAEVLRGGVPQQGRAIIMRYVERIEVGDRALRIHLPTLQGHPATVLTASIGRLRCGNDARIIVKAGPELTIHPDQQLVQTLADARAAQQLASDNPMKSLADLAMIAKLPTLRFKQLLRLSYLAPSVVGDILSGNTPPAIAQRGLRNLTNIPAFWDDQQSSFELT